MKSWISDFIIEEASRWKDLETGGVLAGYATNNDIVVTNIVGPGPKAKHNKMSFIPDNKYHNEQMANIYKASNQIEAYIGDWHTHPNSIAYLSDRDKTTLRKIGTYKKARLPSPLMLVLGTSNMEMKIWIYCLNQEGEKVIEPCNLILFD